MFADALLGCAAGETVEKHAQEYPPRVHDHTEQPNGYYQGLARLTL